ncbi:MAG: Gfo/Idh/MocA family oxidoreductase [Verrucomicrobiales bacterium]|nr:Gfo/Idh/MocA family oxidoreductase [Verrucomicrobiales bacterium]
MQESQASSKTTRRGFVKSAAAATFGFQFVPSHVWGANSRVNFGAIGSGGKGKADIGGSVGAGMQCAALVDIVDVEKFSQADANGSSKSRLKSITDAREKYPDAKFYTDYREMIADMGDKIDAVTVSTPDHHHFHASLQAMRAGKHVYCQKPLTHSIWEARVLTQLAKETGVKTQMGNQAHANSHMRRVVELVRAGLLGEVKEVHAWTNRPIWPQGFKEAPEKEDVPLGLDWEQWIGPAEWVDYSPRIAPFAWRGWWNFGTGALGDMACHIMDMPYWALELGSPTTIRAKQEGVSDLSAPINSTITYNFADKGIQLHWYDGQKGAKFDRESWKLIPGEFNRPSEKILEGVDYRKYESVIIGERGKLFFDRFRDTWMVKPSSMMDGFATPEPSVPRARDDNNYKEWLDAIDGKVERGQSAFDYAGPFSETVLLGCLAQRTPGKTLKWDAENMKVKGHPELDSVIRREYRKGWEVEM